MRNIFQDNSQSIGDTPLVKLNRMTDKEIYVKVESRNPAGSVKCRIGANMIWEAEERGILKPGMAIVEPTSGNTGIALAYVCAAKGYSLTLTMPDTMSMERRKLIKALGAKLELTPGALGIKGAIDKATEIYQADPKNTWMPQQFNNPANPAIHEKTTGPEIWKATYGKIDILVAGVGTGGTISGISRYIKNTAGKPITSVAVEPSSSPVITQTKAGQELTHAPHKIQGIGTGFIPGNLDIDLIDETETIDNDEAIESALTLMRDEGILAGISSGAAVAAALRQAEKPGNEGKVIVAILPDSGERYLSSPLFDGVFGGKETEQ